MCPYQAALAPGITDAVYLGKLVERELHPPEAGPVDVDTPPAARRSSSCGHRSTRSPPASAGFLQRSANMRLVSGPGVPLLDELRTAAERHAPSGVQIAVAWVNEEGAALFLEAVSSHVERLRAIVGINNQGTTIEGLLRLLAASDELRVLYQHPMVTFHPKTYCFDNGAAGTLLVGSSNLTAGGLDTNFEASVVLTLTAALRQQWQTFWLSLETHDFAFAIDSPADVERLYKGGYVALESTTRARRRRMLRRKPTVLEGEDGDPFGLPTAGPQRRFRRMSPSIEVPFEVVEEPPDLTTDEETDFEFGEELATPPPPAEGAAPLVFVRTLTPNDVAKLHGHQTGTFEPDLGLAARDENPEFWGWPDSFSRVVRTLTRFERAEQVDVISRATGPAGITANLVIWFREERPGHPAEFRLSPRPISTVRVAVPDDFDDTSVLVVEKSNGSFVIRLVTSADPDYDAYASVISVVKPAHRYGYGRRP